MDNINRRRMKARAPPPPNHPPTTCKVNNETLTTDVGILPDQGVIYMKDNLINRTMDFTVVFPNGEEQKDTVHGSKAVMDLLVDLCSRCHLNPAHHMLELLSWGTQQPLSYKPNTLIGILDVQKILLKEKVPEGKGKRPPPKIPEKTVRLVVNYLKTQKAVVRVSPEVPLQSIIPAICEKCEVNQEYLVLLRDTFTGEELELTKSLNELGIKELYAWDRKRETRSSTTIYDTTEKGKTRFLGFFKTSKRGVRAEEYLTTRMDGDYGREEHSKAASASEQSLEGITTAPQSSSVNSSSITLGPSLSLGNISGTTGSTEIKKRRAPPPPLIGEQSGQEKVLHQISRDSSQNDLQKKKRRAPPPPIPIMPERTKEIEDKRKSAVGNLQLSDTYSMDDVALELSELEEATSLNSCLASEDTTEDSGVMSSLSDAVSLNSQNGSMKSRDMSPSVQENSTEMDSMFAMEICSVRNTSFNSDDAGNIHQRSSDDEQAMETKFEDADMFIDVRLQETLAALDKDLAAMEGMHDNSENGYLSGKMNEASNPLPLNAEATLDVSLPVPVTIIDEVLEDEVTIPCNREGESLLSRIEANENTSVQSVSHGELHNENNNTGTLKREYIDGELSCLSKIILQQQLPNEDFRHQVEEEQTNESETHVSTCEKKNKQDAILEKISKNEEIISESDSQASKTKMIVSNLTLLCKTNRTEDKEWQTNKENTKEELLSKIKTELKFRNVSAKSPEEKEGSLSPSLQSHRIINGITNYENKIGLRTFKVVPHKPEVKYFERDASLSTGAIKIDELGNLVTPNIGGIRKVPANNTTLEEIEETKVYCSPNSIKKQLDESSVHYSTKTMVITHSKSLTKISQTKPENLTSMKALSPLANSGGFESKIVPQKTKPAIQAKQSPVKTFTVPLLNADKVELPFQKPHRRTSSCYIASAIAKCIDLSQVKTNQERCDKEETSNEKGVKTETEPLSRSSIMTRNGPVETQPTKIEESSDIHSSRKNTLNILPLGAHSGNNIANIKSPDQIKSTNNYHDPHHRTSSKDSVIAEGDHCSSSIKNVIVKEVPFLPNKKEIDPFSSPFFLRSSNAHSSSISFSLSVKGDGEYSYNRRASAGTHLINPLSSKKDEKSDDTPRKNEPDSNIRNDNIYHVFGPKKKFKPVIQKPLPKDSSLHGALMEAIQSAGGRENLRKISSSTGNETQKKPLATEPENERSALLAAIRGHSGTSNLRKTSSSASEELQRFQNAEAVLKNRQASTIEQDYNQPPHSPLPPPPSPPPPPPQLTLKAPRFFVNKIKDNPVDTRQALMEAIRSGTGAARLRKVPLPV